MKRKSNRFKVRMTAAMIACFGLLPPANVSAEEFLRGTGGAELEQEWQDEAEEKFLSGTEDEEGSAAQFLQGEEEGVSRSSFLPNISQALDNAQNYLVSHVTEPRVATVGGEWAVIAMARHNVLRDTVKSSYLGTLYETLYETKGNLDERTYTEYSRVVLALSSIGVSPETVAGYNLLYPLSDLEKVQWQGINGSIWALLAADAGAYEFPDLTEEDLNRGKTQTTRELLIQTILDAQLSDSGWALSGDKADPDLTAMAIQALAPYYYARQDVQKAADRAVLQLSQMQQADGGFGDAEASAQVIIAFSALNPDLLADNQFIKNGNSVLDGLLGFQKEDGSFVHAAGQTESDGMASEQCTLALEAYYRAGNGMNALYDMTDTAAGGTEQESQENINLFKEKLEQIPENITLADKTLVYGLMAELDQMGKFPEKARMQKQLKDMAQELSQQEAAVEKLDQDIWNTIQPLKVTLKDKKKAEKLMERYENLPDQNKEFVENRSDLMQACTIIEKLENGYLGKEVFENVTASREDYTYESSEYSIILKGKNDYTPADMPLDMEIQQNSGKLVLKTAARGKLPGKVEVCINSSMKDGTYIWYLQDGSEKKALEWTGVHKGIVTCSISSGGTYILEKPEMHLLQEFSSESNTNKENKLSGTSSQENKESKTSQNNGTSTKKSTAGNTASTGEKTKVQIKDGVVDKKQFEEIKGKDETLRIPGKTDKGEEYELAINGKDIKTPADMKTGMQTTSEHETDIKKLAENPSIYHFEHSGAFPGEMLAEVSIDKEDGDYLLFYYNTEERKAEYKQKVTVKDKKTKFLLSQGGDYFIDTRAKVKSLDEIESSQEEDTGTSSEKTLESRQTFPEEELLAGTQDTSNSGLAAGIIVTVLVLFGGSAAVYGIRIRKRVRK